MALTKREARTARLFARYERLGEKAKAYYDRADKLGGTIARSLKGKAMRISESKLLEARDQYQEGIAADDKGEDSKLWGHGAVRRWKLTTRSAD